MRAFGGKAFRHGTAYHIDDFLGGGTGRVPRQAHAFELRREEARLPFDEGWVFEPDLNVGPERVPQHASAARLSLSYRLAVTCERGVDNGVEQNAQFRPGSTRLWA